MRSLAMKYPVFKEPTPSEEASSSRESQGDEEIGPHRNSIMNGEVLTLESAIATASRSITRASNLTQLARVGVAEMVGTSILMFSVCGIIAVTRIMRGEVGLLEYAATGGLSITVVIFSVGSISGAHVNPSVTIAFASLGAFPWSKVPLYILAQMLGSVIGTYVGKSVYGIDTEMMTTHPLQGRSTAFWAELIATFIVVFLAASLSSHPRAVSHLAGFVVGIAIALAILITGPVSGGSLNPARSFGPALISWKFDDIWLYLFAPTLGAVAATLLFRLLRLQHHPSSSSTAPSCAPANPSVD
ncbi:probable aquaporin NIP7-1 [Macadamia integrifolia]|uniref:probable aquaporin NIP7-1 n=1 Tax=Macadamia integrifolia TaxID=60698 RepID=UPI001C4F9059|nr:probable aquaporin NIP7-1 [Macadamia integrifolia]XP_042518564.1 probable aquaporin NIP7-1 [Macadamia integrifolia]